MAGAASYFKQFRRRFDNSQSDPVSTPHRCEVVLGEFLKEIKKTPSSVKFAEMANILVIHCQVSDESKLSKGRFHGSSHPQ